MTCSRYYWHPLSATWLPRTDCRYLSAMLPHCFSIREVLHCSYIPIHIIDYRVVQEPRVSKNISSAGKRFKKNDVIGSPNHGRPHEAGEATTLTILPEARDFTFLSVRGSETDTAQASLVVQGMCRGRPWSVRSIGECVSPFCFSSECAQLSPSTSMKSRRFKLKCPSFFCLLLALLGRLDLI